MRMILFSSMLLIALISFASSEAADKQIDFRSLEACIQEELIQSNTTGVAFAIVSGDKVIFAKGFGRDFETGTPITSDSQFALGSTTKVFTAYTLLALAEDGKIDINQPIGRHASGLSPRFANVTAAQLLSHTAGLKDWDPSQVMDLIKRQQASDPGRYLRSLNDSSFFTQPGEIFSYSNPGFNIAGFLISEVGGKPYVEAVMKKMLKPLGMNNTTLNSTIDPSVAFWPCGSMVSTAEDMAQLAIAFINKGSIDGKQVLSPTVIAQMATPRIEILGSPRKIEYGYGLFIENSTGMRIIGHEGNAEHFTSIFQMVPERRFGLIILSNAFESEFPNSTRKAYELVLGIKPELLSEFKPQTMSQSEMARYVGMYSQYPHMSYNIQEMQGKLFLNVTNPALNMTGKVLPMEKVGENMFAIDITLPGTSTVRRGYIGLVPGKDGEIEYLVRGDRAYGKIRAPPGRH